MKNKNIRSIYTEYGDKIITIPKKSGIKKIKINVRYKTNFARKNDHEVVINEIKAHQANRH